MRGLSDCITLADVLRLRAEKQPDRHAYTFLKDGEIVEARLTYGELDRHARAVAASLQDKGAEGEHAVLLYPPGLDFVVALLGCWHAGVVAIPAYPPLREGSRSRFQSIMADARPKLALTSTGILAETRLVPARDASTCQWLATDAVSPDRADAWRDPRVAGGALALLQYTSGSTASPKGVMVSHANLMANERMIQRAMGHDAESTFVSWLPVYHDMGLIGNLLQPLFIGAPCHLMSPVAFLQEPSRWLRAISTYRAHTSGAPDFAYDLCVQKVTPEQQSTLDLSSWQVAYNGSEPVRAETLDRFAAKFERCGFRRTAFHPCYGLAEATLLVSGGAKGVPPVVRSFDAAALKHDRVLEAAAGSDGAQALVSCGHTVLDQQIVVVNPESRLRCPDGQVGEIWVRGPNVGQGYWNRPDATAATFHARLSDTGEGPFLRTGDLGFMRDAELFIAGRSKDLIIIRGQNHYPQDIERTAERSHAALRRGGSAAFSVDVAGREQLVVIAEVDRQHLRRLDSDPVILAIRQAVAESHELRVHAVLLVKPGTLPQTSSGKRQRHLSRARFLDGHQEAVAEWRDTIDSDARLPEPDLMLSPPEGDDLEAWLVSELAARLSLDKGEIDVQHPMTRYGIDSLVAIELCHRIESTLRVALPVADLLGDSSITQIAGKVRSRRTKPFLPHGESPAPAGGQDRDAALSHGQTALWFLQQAAPGSPAYNIARALRIQVDVDMGVLREAFQLLVDRHASLRTNFILGDDGPRRKVHPQASISFEEENGTGWDSAEFAKRLADEAHRPFDLERDALLRVILFRRAPREFVLSICVHHIVTDFWSLALLMRELGESYAALKGGTRPALPALNREYTDFVRWQAELLESADGERLLAFWREHLAGDIPALALPADRPRPQTQSQRGSRISFGIDPDLTGKLRDLCKAEGVTLYMAHLAAFQALLHRYTGQQDLVIGTVSNGRSQAGLSEVVGYFVNTLALRASVSGGESFATLLRQTRRNVLDGLRNQEYPFSRLVEELQSTRDPSRSQLLQVMFVFQQARAGEGALTRFALGEAGAEMDWGGLQVESLQIEQRWAQFDLTLTLADVGNEIRGSAQYNTDVFDRATIERMLDHYRTLLAGVVADPGRRIDDLPLTTSAERSQLLAGSNETLVHERFESAARRFPDAIALTCGNEQLTYDQLNRRANRLAHRLRRLGVGPEVPVAICMEPSLAMVTGLLAILKAGGLYVPLDPSYPEERLALILDDVGAPVVLSEEGLPERLSARPGQVLCLSTDEELGRESEENPSNWSFADNAAYVIHTSGSSGTPKGSVVSHRNVVRLFDETSPWFAFGECDVWALFHSFAFDFSVWEIWGALFHGGRLVVVPRSTRRSPETFYDVLVRERVTVLNQTPSAFHQLMAVDEEAGARSELALRLVIFGGEALNLPRLKPWFERHGDVRPRLVNMYGITETTVHVTYRPLLSADAMAGAGSVIGRPIPDLQVYLLDGNLQPVPVGVPGELYVAGAGLARGYLDRPDLTAERFIPHPYARSPGERLYRSGDLARTRSSGDIEYLGRIDDQVKIRGFRVEPGEIQAILCQHGDVRDAVVVAREREADAKQLVAYVVPRENAASAAAELRDFLNAKLPAYMIPSAFVFLERLPLTPNGKLNLKQLPLPEQVRSGIGGNYVAPGTETERVLAEIWSGVLGVEQVGVNDNFFNLGGDSIRSVQVVSRARARGLPISVQQLFQYQDIATLSEQLHADATPAPASSRLRPFELLSGSDRQKLPDGIENAYPLAMLQAGLVYHSESRSDYQVYVSSFHLRVPLDAALFREALRRLAERHDFFRTSLDVATFSEPLQLVHSKVELPLVVEDIRHLDAEAQESRLKHRFEEEKQRRFAWEQAPLARFFVHHRSESTLQVTLCEPMLDGWSVASLMADLLQDYRALLQGEPLVEPPPRPAVSFAEFVALERKALQSEDCQRYWTKQLEDCTSPTLVRGADNDRERGPSVIRIEVPIPTAVSNGLHDVARSMGLPLKSVLLAAHLKVVGTLSGRSDAITGLVSNGRPEEADADRVVGLFLNTLPFRQNLAGGAWAELARATWKTEQELLPFRRYPIAKLQKEHGGQPLFDTVFNFTHFHVLHRLQDVDGIELLHAYASDQTYFPLTAQFNLEVHSSDLVLALDCGGGQFSRAQLESIGGSYQRALVALSAEPAGRYERVNLLSSSEVHEQLVEWNATARPYGEGRCIHELFEAQVSRTPERTAVVWGNERWTYRELNVRAEELASRLRARGVGPEVLVGVCLERGLALVAAVLGVLKAGGAYVPLDPGYPAERRAYMLADAGVRWVVSEAGIGDGGLGTGVGSGVEVVSVDAHGDSGAGVVEGAGEGAGGGGSGRAGGGAGDGGSRVTGANLAYVIYTSGSTGKPKGVAIEHRSLVNLLEWAREAYTEAELAGVLACTSICFDLSLFELFVPLSWGGTVLLVEHALQLPGMPARDEVRLINTVPSVLGELLQQPDGIPAGVRTINLAGEPLRSGLVRALHERGVGRVVDLYGPTEATTYSTFGARESNGPETIGRPLANTRLHVLDAHQQPVPVGVAGEVYLGGAGLARGYLGRAELTAERFVPDPWSAEPGARLYRTGDKGRHLPDGRVEFLGRADGLVKLRGYRIELGEVEAALAAHRGVQEAVVVVRDEAPGGRRLVGYVVGATEPAPTAAALRGFLGQTLPHYMIPSQLVVLDALPRTPNGKVDRRALPVPDSTVRAVGQSCVSPRTPTEALLAKIWAQVLGLESVGIQDNFFELGGDSILSIQIVARANQAGVRLTHKQIFQHQTISGLAEVVVVADSHPAQQEPVTGPVPLTPIQRWLLETDLPNPHHWNQAVLLETERDIDPALLRSVVERVLLHHDALRLRFESREDGWHQVTAPPDTAVPFTTVDFSHIPAAEQSRRLEESAAQWQTTLDISAGPLARVILYDLGEGRPGRLLIIVHHLAVDGISWRILLEDIQQGYLQLSQGGEVRLPAKTTSYQDWAHLLDGYAASDELLSELPFWSSDVRSRVGELPQDVPSGANENTEGSARVVSLSLTPDDTRALLHQVPAVYHTQINDVLLAALGDAFSRWTGADSLSLDLEGHGREPISDDIDLSRTVGWFTAVFPITLDSRRRSQPGALLKSVKEQLRRIPNRGMGYGVLSYLGRDPQVSRRLRSLPRPQVIFNYLGQFGQVLPRTSMFRLARESTGPTHGPLGARRYLLEVRAGIYEDRLKVDWTYSGNVHREATISELAAAFMASLRAILRHCSSPEAGGHTPSDFPLAKLDQEELDELLAGTTGAIEDIYPLAPMQAGMLFHAVHAPDTAAYCMQISCTILGSLDVPAFGNAWREVVRRHAVLRTTFPGDHGHESLQVVHRDTDLKLSTEDWRSVSSDRQATGLDEFRKADRRRAFDLFTPPLFRLALFRVAEDRHECVWTYHHLVLDGWSAYCVLKDVFAWYGSDRAGLAPHLPAIRPYADYIAWLARQELSVAESFWRQALSGLDGPTPSASDPGAGAAAGVASVTRDDGAKGYGEQRMSLSTTETTALQDLARQHRLTVNTVVQGVWALVLNHYHRTNDVLFGATVTGRPPELPGVESMVGAFINTLPVRVQVAPDQPLKSWLGTIQDQQADLHRYEYTPLMRIHEWSGFPSRSALFDSIIVFENFPVDFSLHEQQGGLEVRNVQSTINEDYPLIVVVEPASRLSVHMKYDPSLFSGPSIGEILKGVETLLRACMSRFDAPVGDLEEVLSRALGQDRLRAQRDRKDSNARKLQRMRGNAPQVSIDGNDDPGEKQGIPGAKNSDGQHK